MFGLFCIAVCIFLAVAAFTGGNKKELIPVKAQPIAHIIFHKIILQKIDTTIEERKTEQCKKIYQFTFNKTFIAVKNAVANQTQKLSQLKDSLSFTLDKPTEYDYIAPLTKTN